MIGLHGPGLSPQLRWQLGGLELAVLGLALAGVYLGPWLARRTGAAPAEALPPATGRWELAVRAAVIPLFVLALTRAAAASFTPFLYFQF